MTPLKELFIGLRSSKSKILLFMRNFSYSKKNPKKFTLVLFDL